MSRLLVVDVGTTSLRVGLLDERLDVVDVEAQRFPPQTPAPGLVEFDAAALARRVLDVAAAVVDRADEPVAAVGITNQRASAVVWDRTTGEPIAPAIGWQDLRTVFDCISARAEHGFELLPNQSVTKLAWLLRNVEGVSDRDLCFGTIDTWLAWTLCGGAAGLDGGVHVTDHTNAAVTGMLADGGTAWNQRVLDAFAVPPAVLPRLVPSTGVIADAQALTGRPPLAALIGDQQSSLVGQGCVAAGDAKFTFGTGGMLDVCGAGAPRSARRSAHGSFPIVARSDATGLTWGLEAIILSAGSSVEWLRDDLGLIADATDVEALAASVPSSEGTVFVPALLGLGTPRWDFGARGTLLGITRGTTRAHLARAVLEGVAQRGADAIAAAEADIGDELRTIRVDGGMSANRLFVQAVADASGRALEVSPVADATMRGAAFLAGLAVGVFGTVDDAADLWRPAAVVEPGDDPATRAAGRQHWAAAVERSAGWIPELTALDL